LQTFSRIVLVSSAGHHGDVFSERFLNIQQAIWHHIPDERFLQSPDM